jgi:hypothetical protein
MSMPNKLTVIVLDETPVPTDAPPSRPEDFEEQALPLPGFVRKFFVHKSEDVDLAPLKTGLEQVQGEIGALLEDIDRSNVAGFRLGSVEVSLGISAGGSIGVVTAGVTASMSLTFERVDPSTTATP